MENKLKNRRALQRARRRFIKEYPQQWDTLCKLSLQEIAEEIEHLLFQEDYFSKEAFYRKEFLEEETEEEYNQRLYSLFKAFRLEELAPLVGCA